MAFARLAVMVSVWMCGAVMGGAAMAGDSFDGKFYRGTGDTEFLQLLEYARASFAPNPEFQHIAMLYTADWNGFVEGPTWGAWWIQNSYGPTYCALPFYQEPYTTFLQNAQDLWFDQMGDGTHAGDRNYVRARTDVCATPPRLERSTIARETVKSTSTIGVMEFTAAGVVMQSELLLISRDAKANCPLPAQAGALRQFHRVAARPQEQPLSRRPRRQHAWPPAYAGWRKLDGTYDKAYLTGPLHYLHRSHWDRPD